jgi:hypothetical protein
VSVFRVTGPKRPAMFYVAAAVAAMVTSTSLSAQAGPSRGETTVLQPAPAETPWYTTSLRAGAVISTLSPGAGPGWRTGVLVGATLESRSYAGVRVGGELVLQEGGGVAFTAVSVPGMARPSFRTRQLHAPLLLHYDTSRPDVLGPDFVVGPALIMTLQAQATEQGLQADLFRLPGANKPTRVGGAVVMGVGLPFATPYGTFRVELRHIRGTTDLFADSRERAWTVSLGYALR